MQTPRLTRVTGMIGVIWMTGVTGVTGITGMTGKTRMDWVNCDNWGDRDNESDLGDYDDLVR